MILSMLSGRYSRSQSLQKPVPQSYGEQIKAASIVRSGARITELQLAGALIEEHRQGLREKLETVKGRGSPKWPKCSEKWMLEKADRAASRLQRDFEHLLDRSRVWVNQCTDGITILMNVESYLQSQKAIQQAEGVVKLTLPTFFFVPLSFTTSFFSMNFDELNRHKNIWIWFVMSGPLLLLTFPFWHIDIFKILTSCMCFFRYTTGELDVALAREVQ